MKTYTQKLVLLLFFSLGNASAMADGTDGVSGSPEGTSTTLSQQAALSPRDYCTSTGGKVDETNQPHIYICCYAKKQKCIVSNTKKTISWSIPYGKDYDYTLEMGAGNNLAQRQNHSLYLRY